MSTTYANPDTSSGVDGGELTIGTQADFQRLEVYDGLRTNLAVALDWIERETQRAVKLTNRTAHVEACQNGPIELWPVPLAEVTSVTYLDVAGVVQTLNPSSYVVDTHHTPGLFRFRDGFERVAMSKATARPITINYTVGYADLQNAPATLIAAARILASGLYENREPSAPVQLHEVPMGVRRLLDLNRIPRLEGV